MRALKKNRKEQRKREVSTKTEEKWTTEEIEELMGVNKPVYKRKKGGSFKQL